MALRLSPHYVCSLLVRAKVKQELLLARHACLFILFYRAGAFKIKPDSAYC